MSQFEIFPDDIALHPLYKNRDQALLHALLQSIDYGVLVSDLNRQDIMANKRLGELFAIPPQLIVQSDPDTVRAWARTRVRNPRRFEAMIQRAYDDPLFTGQDEIELRENPPKVLRRFTAPLMDSNGHPIGRLWTFLDISEMKRLQAQVRRRLRLTTQMLQETRKRLLETEKLRVAGTLSASVAHDIRNILAAMRVELEQLSGENSKALVEQFYRFEVLAHRLMAITNPNTCHREPTDLNEVARRVANLLQVQAELHKVQFRLLLEEPLPSILADPPQIERLLINLCLNAIQAMAVTGGVLTLCTHSQEKKVRLSVADTGPGIPPEIRERLFEPFFTTRRGGTGLGLFSCKRIVAEHKGRILLRSRPGQGACFVVSFPQGGAFNDPHLVGG